MPDLFLLFNHHLTGSQADQARKELGVENIVVPPENISRRWANVPPEAATIRTFLEPVFSWIDTAVAADDYLLIQGDFGACHLALEHIAGSGIIPVYATTRRRAVEQRLDEKTVRLTHTFRHVRFRKYGE